jgi:hypothetical protein
VIAEVSANFAHHGRNGERQEIRTVLGVEAVHRLNQPRIALTETAQFCSSKVLTAWLRH